MNDRLLVETAVLAGEIMLVSGAEIYRVEDTINHILGKAGRDTAEAIVFSTGIFASLNDPAIEAITIARRVTGRSTNLNRVYLVNDVSRGLWEGRLTVEEAYGRLREIKGAVQYNRWLKDAGTIGVAVFFALLLGGADQMDSVIAAAFVSSLVVALSSHISARIFKAPVTVFLVAGILPSVPGTSIYRSVSYVISNNPQMSSHYLVETLQIAGSIAMAVFIMDSLFRLGRKK